MEIVRRKKSDKQAKNEGGGNPTSRRRKAMCLELSSRHLYRRAFSEVTLLDLLGSFDFKDGTSYHFITAGDVDSLSYLKAMVRAQRLDHVLLSTWCMAAEDIFQLQEWVKNGNIRKLDMYVGEIFPSTYKVEFEMLPENVAKENEMPSTLNISLMNGEWCVQYADFLGTDFEFCNREIIDALYDMILRLKEKGVI